MASPLTIPLELLVSISSLLSTQDLGSFRLTCQHVEKSLYEWFSKEFFTKKQFMLTQPSLQALVDISKHAGFSQKLTHVILATNMYDDIPLRFRDEDAATAYIEGCADQKALMDNGVDREMLTEAFQNLENLHTVGIRDFNSDSRTRDGAKASWSSWGAPTVYRETGIELSLAYRGIYTPSGESRSVSHLFSTLVYALGKANRMATQFEVLLRRNGIPQSSFHIPSFMLASVTPVLKNVEALLLTLDLKFQFLHTCNNGTPVDNLPGRSLRRFLSHTPNLTHLRLNFQKNQLHETDGFLQWLSEPVPAVGSTSGTALHPAPIALPFLKQLEFGQMDVGPDILLATIAKFAPTLQDMSLWRVALCKLNTSYSNDRKNLWSDFIRRLAKIPKMELTHLKVGMLSQNHMHVNFATEGTDNKPDKVREYSGKKMGSFMEELVEQVVVKWPTPVPTDEESNGESEDEDEEMLDEENSGSEDNEDDEDYEE